jgi:hypothetical protein
MLVSQIRFSREKKPEEGWWWIYRILHLILRLTVAIIDTLTKTGGQ